MDVSPSVQKMMLVLKEELRTRGLRQRDIAARLGVSEITVKRYLSGKGSLIGVLEKLAALVDLDLLSLAQLVRHQNDNLPRLSKAQQAALGRDKTLATVFVLLMRGWSPSRIEQEFEANHQRIEVILSELQKLGLIQRVSDGVRLLAAPDPDEKGGDLLAHLSRERAQIFLSELNLRDQECEWYYYGARLSSGSSMQLKELIKKFMDEVRELNRRDANVHPDDVKWYKLFIGAQPMRKPHMP